MRQSSDDQALPLHWTFRRYAGCQGPHRVDLGDLPLDIEAMVSDLMQRVHGQPP
jgi:hypothetical protein